MLNKFHPLFPLNTARWGRALWAAGTLGLLSACGAPLQPEHTEHPVGRARLVLPPGEWVELGRSNEALPFQPELLPNPSATIDLQTQAVGLRGSHNDWLAVLLVQTNRNNQPRNPTLWTGTCPLQQDVWVEDAAGPVRIDCLRFKRWANNSENWLGKNHPTLVQWLKEHRAAPGRPYSHLNYRYATEGGAYVELNAFIDQRLLVPPTHTNDGFLHSGEPAQMWAHQIRQAARQSASMLDGHLRIAPFPMAQPQ